MKSKYSSRKGNNSKFSIQTEPKEHENENERKNMNK